MLLLGGCQCVVKSAIVVLKHHLVVHAQRKKGQGNNVKSVIVASLTLNLLEIYRPSSQKHVYFSGYELDTEL